MIHVTGTGGYPPRGKELANDPGRQIAAI